VSENPSVVDVDKADKKKKIKFYFINKYSCAVVYVSNYLKEYFERNKLSKKSNAKIIYNGIEIGNSPISSKKSVSIKNFGLSLGDTVVCAIGDIRPAKDYETMLLSIKEIKKKIPNIKLLIAGTKTQEFEKLNQFKNELGLNDNVKFLGYTKDIRAVFNVSDLYLSTSTTEGFSLTIVEAMAAGVPVVSTKSGGPEEFIENGRNGLLVKKKSPEEIANAIYRIINNSELRVKIVRNGWKTVKESFNVNLMINNYQKLYMELLEGR